MADHVPVVFIVDDDVSVRESLAALVGDAGWQPESFASAQEFLVHPRPPSPSCLLLDVNLPDLSGLELQTSIADQHAVMPIIFITGYGDIPMTVRAMKAGAIEFLTKPLEYETLVGTIEGALERSRDALDARAAIQELRDRYGSLSRREQEVMTLVVRGRLNKQIAGDLGISEITVKVHRGRVMRKMRVRSLAELVSVAGRLGLETAGTHESVESGAHWS